MGGIGRAPKSGVVLGLWLGSVCAAAGILLAPTLESQWAGLRAARNWYYDSLLHVCLFTWLMFVPHAAKWGRRRRVPLSMLLSVMAVGIEIVPGLREYRTGAISGAMANLAGIWLGAWAGCYWSRPEKPQIMVRSGKGRVGPVREAQRRERMANG